MVGETVLMVLAVLCILLGLVGCIVPILPACPLSYLAVLLLHWTQKVQFEPRQLIVWAILVLLVTAIDYVMPLLGAKKFGGSKLGMWGCTAGIIVGLFVGPLGIILGPFIGAVAGEMLDGQSFDKSLVAGFGSFVGFLSGTFAKLVVSVFLLIKFLAVLF